MEKKKFSPSQHEQNTFRKGRANVSTIKFPNPPPLHLVYF